MKRVLRSKLLSAAMETYLRSSYMYIHKVLKQQNRKRKPDEHR